LTYAAEKVPITVSLADRCQTSRASRRYAVATTVTPPSDASRLAEKSAETSVSPSTVIISAGLATKKASRASTRWELSSRIPQWASKIPTTMTAPMVTKPIRTPSIRPSCADLDAGQVILAHRGPTPTRRVAYRWGRRPGHPAPDQGA
jgi:hypothetical protein